MYVSKECENIPPPFLLASYKSSSMWMVPLDSAPRGIKGREGDDKAGNPRPEQPVQNRPLGKDLSVMETT